MSSTVPIDSKNEVVSRSSIADTPTVEPTLRISNSVTNLSQRPALIIDPVDDAFERSMESIARQLPANYGLSRYVEPFFVYRRWWMGSLLLSLVFAWAMLLVWPRTYESAAKLQLLVGRESVGLDPSSTTTQTLLMQKTMEEDVNSALEILGSRDIAQRVVAELGAENILNGYLPTSGQGPVRASIREQAGNFLKMLSDYAYLAIERSGLRDLISDNERAIVRLEDSVSVFAPKKSSTMIVTARSKSPQMAQAIAQSYTQQFLQRHVDVSTTEGSKQFFVDQAKNAEDSLQKLLQQRSSLLQKHKMASAQSRFNILTTQLATIETTIINSEALIDQSESELGDLTQSIEESETEVVAAKQTQPDQAIVGMRNTLYAAELEQQRRSSVYKEGHPLIEQIDQQVQAARKALEKLEQDSESLSTTPNPIRQKLEEDQLKAKARVVGLSSLLEKSQTQLNQKQNEINELLELELQVDQLDRQIEVAKKSLAVLREKEEQARVVEELRSQRISSVGLAQSATLVEKPIRPRKPVVAAGILMLGLATGIGLVGLREMSRKTVRNTHDVQRWLGYPVIAEIPSIRKIARRRFTTKDILSRRLASVRSASQALHSELVLAEPKKGGSRLRGTTIGVLGLNDDSGASLLAASLALECSDSGNRRTSLIDLDSQKHTLSDVFGLSGYPGIAEFASGTVEQTDGLHQAENKALSLVGSTSEPMQRGSSGDVKSVLGMLVHLAESADYIICDFPPACRPDQILQLAKELDQIVIVVRSEFTETAVVARLIERIEKANGNIAGIALTRSRKYVPGWVSGMLG